MDLLTKWSISLSPKSNRSRRVNCDNDNGKDVKRFSRNSNDFKFVSLKSKNKLNRYINIYLDEKYYIQLIILILLIGIIISSNKMFSLILIINN